MPLDETDLKHIWDMLDAARRVVVYTADQSRGSYLGDRMRQDAVERAIEIVGEAARRVSEQARAEVADVQWSAIVATRHILAHKYGEVDHDRIWRIATVHVPALIAQLTPVLEANPPGPESQQDPAEP
jgi:uncharacterized protein with HEPN domain